MLLRKKEYLARAEEADQHAENIKDPSLREAWKRIANDYRALAATVDKPPSVVL